LNIASNSNGDFSIFCHEKKGISAVRFFLEVLGDLILKKKDLTEKREENMKSKDLTSDCIGTNYTKKK